MSQPILLDLDPQTQMVMGSIVFIGRAPIMSMSSFYALIQTLRFTTHSHIIILSLSLMATETGSAGPSWAELLGSDGWSDLLEPLDLSLRRLVLRCGDLCQVAYDALNSDEHSRYCGSSRYGRATLLQRTLFPFAADYDVTDLLYATSENDLPAAFLLFSLSREAWSKESNWIGYVAASSDAAAAASGRRDIFVTWRGTIRNLEWVDVLQPELVPLDPILPASDDSPKVMKGWHTIYTSSDAKSPFSKLSAREQVLAAIGRLVTKHRAEKLSIVCVGHSLGASLAILSAFDMVQSGLSKIKGSEEYFPVCAVVFGSPQVGNEEFKKRVEGTPELKVLHVKQKIDLIPRYPTGLLGFAYTGRELVVDGRKSPWLKDSKDPSDWHNLQGILHAVAGWNGEDGEFELRVQRSVALVNKSSQYLKDEYLVPGSWWVEKNRGMVLGEDGEWALAPPDEADIPVPPEAESGGGGGPTSTPDGNASVLKNDEKPAKKKSRSLVSCFKGAN